MLTHVTIESFHDQVIEVHGLVLVNFWTPWNDECRKMKRIMNAIKGVLEFNDKIFQVNWEQQKSLADNLEIFGIPTVLFFLDGKEVGKRSGLLKKIDLIQQIERIKHSPYLKSNQL